MSDEPKSDQKEDRLDRIEALVEANSQQIEKNSQQIERNSQQIEKNSQQIEKNSQQIEKNANAIIDLRVAVSSLIETSNQFQQNFEVMVAEIVSLRQESAARQLESEKIQTEIRGLQIENRRILDHLFGPYDYGDAQELE